MKMFIARCYFIAIEFVKYARKSLLKEYRLKCRPTEYISREIIPNIGTGYFHGKSTNNVYNFISTSICVAKCQILLNSLSM